MPLIIAPPFDDSAYERILSESGGDAESVFVELGIPIAQRYLQQIGVFPKHTDKVGELLKAVWQVAHERPLPRPLGRAETGEAKDPDEGRIRELIQTVEGKLDRDMPETLDVFTYQLLVMVTQEEFKACRLSYQAENVEGEVERQDADYCKDRISGSHCEDCPYFVALSQEKHERLMQKQWIAGAEAFEAEKATFLPSDYRMLRIFWYLHLRAASGSAQA